MGKGLDGEYRPKRTAWAWDPIAGRSFYVVIPYCFLGVIYVKWLKFEAQSDTPMPTQPLLVWRPLLGVM